MADYVLVCAANTALNTTLHHVTSDTFTDDRRMEVLDLVNRGRQVQLGNRLGHEGSLTCQLYDRTAPVAITARAQRLQVEALRDANLAFVLNNPWGDSWPVVITSVSISRIAGTGLHEAMTATINYTEIDP